MLWFEKWLAGALARICTIFDVSPDGLRRGRRGNQPPPSGGIGSF